jgi:hypothetical protein
MKKSAAPDLLEMGIFTIPEVAKLVNAPQAHVRVWVEGHTGKQVAVIENQLGRVNGKVAVSFTNLMELRFVATFVSAGVGLREIRKIMDEVRRWSILTRLPLGLSSGRMAGRLLLRSRRKTASVSMIFERRILRCFPSS